MVCINPWSEMRKDMTSDESETMEGLIHIEDLLDPDMVENRVVVWVCGLLAIEDSIIIWLVITIKGMTEISDRQVIERPRSISVIIDYLLESMFCIKGMLLLRAERIVIWEARA